MKDRVLMLPTGYVAHSLALVADAFHMVRMLILTEQSW